MRSTESVIPDIENFNPVDGEWRMLDTLADELWGSDNYITPNDIIFAIFKRFLTKDGAGIFWSVLHGLETMDYEEKLHESLANKPSYMGLIMLKRIENSGKILIAKNLYVI